MIHTTLPMRPRLGSDKHVYLIGPLSLFSQKNGKHILSITTLKSDIPNLAKQYVETVSKIIGNFDSVYFDASSDFQEYVKNKINLMNSCLYSANCTILTCSCGRYEEKYNARRYNVTNIKNNLCVSCKSNLETNQSLVLMFESLWKNVFFENMHPTWVKKDFSHFLQRQPETYLFSKKNEKTRIYFSGREYGVRYQFIWAIFLGYIASRENDNQITLHYINKVQDKVFFVASVAKMIFPELQISLKALPVIWPSKMVDIFSCTSHDLKLLIKGLESFRKEIRV